MPKITDAGMNNAGVIDGLRLPQLVSILSLMSLDYTGGAPTLRPNQSLFNLLKNNSDAFDFGDGQGVQKGITMFDLDESIKRVNVGAFFPGHQMSQDMLTTPAQWPVPRYEGDLLLVRAGAAVSGTPTISAKDAVYAWSPSGTPATSGAPFADVAGDNPGAWVDATPQLVAKGLINSIGLGVLFAENMHDPANAYESLSIVRAAHDGQVVTLTSKQEVPADTPLDWATIENGTDEYWQILSTYSRYTFENVGALRQYIPQENGVKSVFLAGIGGGDFDWVADSIEAENGFVIGITKTAGTIVRPSGATVGAWVRRYERLNPVMFGANAEADANSIAHNTAVMQHILNTFGDAPITIYVPVGCWYNWGVLTLPDYTSIIDDSGYDAQASNGVQQSYRRLISKTSASTGATNGSTHWLTADYHPAHISNVLANAGDAGARASFVAWMGSQNNQTVYGTQWTQDFTGPNKLITVAGYDNSSDPAVATRLSVIRHPADAENAGAQGIGGIPTAGYTKETFLAGLSSSPNYLTKSLVVSDTLPTGSTGKIVKLFKKGASVLFRREINDDGMSYVLGGTSMHRVGLLGEFSGVLRKVLNKTTSYTVPRNDSRGVITNTSAAGGFTITLPEATVGLEFEFAVTSANNMNVTPKVDDNFAGWTSINTGTSYKQHTIGSYMQSATVGHKLKIKCLVEGVWDYERYGDWTDQP